MHYVPFALERTRQTPNTAAILITKFAVVDLTGYALMPLRFDPDLSRFEFERNRCSRAGTEGGGGGGVEGIPIYGLYRYVPREKVWFFRFLILLRIKKIQFRHPI